MKQDTNTSKFDIFEPKSGHQERFLIKMHQKKNKNRFSISRKWMVAASFLLLFGLGSTMFINYKHKSDVAPEISESQRYFSSIINQEIKEIKQINTKETNKVFNDALARMERLEKAYQKLVTDYKKNKSKYLLNAMIENFNQRIEILQFVKQQIEEINQTKNHQNETYKA